MSTVGGFGLAEDKVAFVQYQVIAYSIIHNVLDAKGEPGDAKLGAGGNIDPVYTYTTLRFTGPVAADSLSRQ